MYFSQEEKAFYNDVMQENYKTVIFLVYYKYDAGSGSLSI
ncbi:PREDICTED: zinc finger protein 75A-like [Galeopterus variegatus]|uniref:Zinc finger protein 75A-like n=1 Tax=Galeopterus variegatus TaxID=482537 RepID=A0ABM0QXU0_GALVR|nr:PREDICTED: zinc finger protein 75A-like [Galeopterus variegatus]